MHELSRRLLYYKQKEIQKQIVDSSKDREVGIRYGDRGFGKRPDVLVYESDVLTAVKNGATSFHVSEERWDNPLNLNTEMKKSELDGLRIGWDLVLDIDCPYWVFSKLTTALFIRALKEHGIKSISCKFSGNKGFHIGVPFEAFPEKVNEMPVKDWFPEGPKRIAIYLLDYVANNLIDVKGNEVFFSSFYRTTIEEISETTGKTKEELSKATCSRCKKEIKDIDSSTKKEFLCSTCDLRLFKEEPTMIQICPKCKKIMEKIEYEKPLCNCGSSEYKVLFDPLSIVDVDTILISSRHMYRAPYSMHEKSGLASLPIDPLSVMDFEKEMADTTCIPKRLKPFLSSEGAVKGEAMTLLVNSFDYKKSELQYENRGKEQKEGKREFDEVTEAIPKEFFPPCILKILEGLEDGKKRSLFLLTNFLTSIGWSHTQAQDILLEWNTNNKPPLKQQDIINQVTYHKRKNKKVLPPNCRSYYQDFHVCFPDPLCMRIKNPAQYSKLKSNYGKKTGRERLTDEQKEIRRKYRESLKKKQPT